MALPALSVPKPAGSKVSSGKPVRGANDNCSPGEACVTDGGTVLPSVDLQETAHRAVCPPELVRLVAALARRAAREDYLAARAQARTLSEKPE